MLSKEKQCGQRLTDTMPKIFARTPQKKMIAKKIRAQMNQENVRIRKTSEDRSVYLPPLEKDPLTRELLDANV
jgi:hypothetical protein